jgi:hypothetical protein
MLVFFFALESVKKILIKNYNVQENFKSKATSWVRMELPVTFMFAHMREKILLREQNQKRALFVKLSH